MTKIDSPLLKVSEVARRLNLDKITVYRWIHSGKLRFFRLGGYSIRIKEKDLNKFIKERENESKD